MDTANHSSAGQITAKVDQSAVIRLTPPNCTHTKTETHIAQSVSPDGRHHLGFLDMHLIREAATRKIIITFFCLLFCIRHVEEYGI